MTDETVTYAIIPTPLGEIVGGTTSRGCCLSEFLDDDLGRIREGLARRCLTLREGRNEFLEKLRSQLAEYFNGGRKSFDLPLDFLGTAFERKVWSKLTEIPYGETRAYGILARELGYPGAARAVGRANGANHLPIIVPCHRVIEAGGGLRGYGGGLWRKKYLLELEGAVQPLPLFSCG